MWMPLSPLLFPYPFFKIVPSAFRRSEEWGLCVGILKKNNKIELQRLLQLSRFFAPLYAFPTECRLTMSRSEGRGKNPFCRLRGRGNGVSGISPFKW
ncbi:hypothetical protein TNIN_284311 [Trichonephila inaurata madagascariensis]|uniref:Uncharacterized protein n=1 Tax=Trichonephila inaurata madagascariensis TaxID=2747483 RepID=A0A8X7CPW0_9ARAC|nr:hypothetical protein TNIN_284311 [Trichonephila inaurata madagascariensis]